MFSLFYQCHIIYVSCTLMKCGDHNLTCGLSLPVSLTMITILISKLESDWIDNNYGTMMHMILSTIFGLICSVFRNKILFCVINTLCTN